MWIVLSHFWRWENQAQQERAWAESQTRSAWLQIPKPSKNKHDPLYLSSTFDLQSHIVILLDHHNNSLKNHCHVSGEEAEQKMTNLGSHSKEWKQGLHPASQDHRGPNHWNTLSASFVGAFHLCALICIFYFWFWMAKWSSHDNISTKITIGKTVKLTTFLCISPIGTQKIIIVTVVVNIALGML